MSRKRVAILGSTGSVGTQALEVATRHSDRLEVVALAAGTNTDLLAEQVRLHCPAVVSLATEAAAAAIARTLAPRDPADRMTPNHRPPDRRPPGRAMASRTPFDQDDMDRTSSGRATPGCGTFDQGEADRTTLASGTPRIVCGRDGLLEATTGCGADIVLNAVVGAAGLAATYEAVSNGIDVALANKESLVMAGEIIMAAARDGGAAVLPVDSEPNALHQCLRGVDIRDVRRLILTASGGPFRGWEPERLAGVSPQRALDHPTWKMGPRITVDSATLMNKGFEVIETHWLLGMPVDKIDVVVHPQSVVHSLIELIDGSMIAHAGATDMRLPIQDALSYPERWERAVEALDLPASAPWTFERADPVRYPALALARRALRAGGTAPAILNAADEVAVAAFLDGDLAFDRIVPTVSATLEAMEVHPADHLDAILEADSAARAEARRILAS